MKMGENRKYIKIALTGIAIAAGSCAILFFFYRFSDFSDNCQKIFSILRPFLYGGVIAYILAPLCGKLQSFFEKKFSPKWKRAGKMLAILICILLTVTVIGLLTLIIVPQMVRSVVSIASALPGQLRSLSAEIDKALIEQPDLQSQWHNISKQINAEIEKWTSTDILPLAQSILYGTASYVSDLVVFLKDVLLGLVISVYLLASRKQLAAQAKLMVHSAFNDKWAAQIEKETHYMDKMFNGFLTGKLLDSIIVGGLCFAGCVAMGFSSPILISVIIGVTNIIPFFGPFIGAVPCALLLFLNNPLHCLMFLIFILILQQLDGNVIGPRVLGNTTGLSGFWVTFAILLFGGMWGITGMIVGVPLFAVIYDLISRLCYKFLRRRGKADMIAAYEKNYHTAQEPARKKRPGKDEPEQERKS